jgi:hypothetical protein
MSVELCEEPLHPEVEVQLTGEDGNGFLIACRVRSALRRAGVEEKFCVMFFEEALAGTYDDLLTVVQNWVSVG